MPYRPVRYSTLLHCRNALRFWNASGRRSRSAGQLYAELCREGILESGARCLQEAPPPEGLTREEQQCFRTCMSGLGRAEAQQECEQLDYYRARLQALQQTAEHAARRQAGLPRKLGLAAGMAMALLLI